MHRTVSASGDHDALERGSAHLHVTDRFHPAGRVARSRSEPSAPIASSTSRMPVRPGFRPTQGHVTRHPGREAASARKNAAELRSPGIRMPKGCSGAGCTVTAAPSVDHVDAAHAQHSLGVVAGRQRLDDRGRSVSGKSGQQDCRLHLGARHGRLPGEASSSALARARAAAPFPRGDTSTLAPMARSGSATRRIGRRRSEASPSRVASTSAPASAPARSRIVVPELAQSSTLSGLRRLMPTPAPSSAYRVGWKVAHPHTACAEAGCSGKDIGCGRPVADIAAAAGQRSEDQRSMGDRLVAWNGDCHRRFATPARRAPRSSRSRRRIADHRPRGIAPPQRRHLPARLRWRRGAPIRPRRPPRDRATRSDARASTGRSRGRAESGSDGAPNRAARSHRPRSRAGRR